MTEAIIYTRFSPRKNADTSESCEIQEAICRKHAEDRGYQVLQVFHDPDVSGKDEYREKLWQAIEALPRGGRLIVFKRDRLARNVYLSEQINRAVAARGCMIDAVSGDVEGDGPEHTMIRQVLAAIAEYERKLIALRTSFAMKQHQKNGRRMGRYAPYGSKIDPVDSTILIPAPREQKVLEFIRELIGEGRNQGQIVRALNKERLGSARGKKWNSKSVAKIIERM
ncbi:MAG TPA: recombinase family protein [Armatimonadota bacterium]|nr:recombinase family protein [Armatimonadota bacterium]